MTKQEIFQELLNRVTEMLNNANREREASQYEANQHIGAMISRYDTFKEEAQYMAEAQQVRAAELTSTKNILETIINDKNGFSVGHKVKVTSLVKIVDEDDNTTNYLLAPALGGEKFELDGTEVVILTTTSPIGQQILNKSVGDEAMVMLRGKERALYVESIG